MRAKEIAYSLSKGNWGDGKSVCLWRQEGSELWKIARFQNEDAARVFAKEFGFPLPKALLDAEGGL